jgi:hypothetical protein
MYLTQMGEIPLLTRAQEIALAKKIEMTRMHFRRRVLESLAFTESQGLNEMIRNAYYDEDALMRQSVRLGKSG